MTLPTCRVVNMVSLLLGVEFELNWEIPRKSLASSSGNPRKSLASSSGSWGLNFKYNKETAIHE